MKKIELDEDFIIKSYNEGKTYQEIANILGVKKHTVVSRGKKLGIKTRTSNRRKINIKPGTKFGDLIVIKEHLSKLKVIYNGYIKQLIH